jgi:rhamnose utilization protein RhaD (predicted bifunctional aldolase and dehydrogenase)
LPLTNQRPKEGNLSKSSTIDEILQQLISLSHELGRENRHLAILGEGNTSANCHDGTFLVKASGSQLGTIEESGFSRVRFAALEELMRAGDLSDADVAEGLRAALLDQTQSQPSVETFMHALCLGVGGAQYVGHTHPISLNQILCSHLGAEPFKQHLFPDAVVVCGKAPAVVPYVDPGFALAKVIRDELLRYQDAHSKSPKLLLMVNHGMTALGQNAREVLNIHLMADKWARILQGTYALGGPNFMPEDEADRIDSRLDEHYRRRQLTK